ncbi:hypothetical protein NBRC10512_000539 [Rhodotorula toruloides]|uniref:RHTO0S02e09208g1_1 n=2 Tax=Rhodotorula toruloides TaxID=5286 RepID=A0A061AHG0_RHOTO|nr:uncharacterized protein RHTO_07365 [Rhodotorula toruloides NP11]EMS23631.1 hypothetical protein RHTO_07365 [Rhodotorula toruloides NP11]CDR36967.1 RHTO0S02e09208g1_1 [Rhodotorula toruloides]
MHTPTQLPPRTLQHRHSVAHGLLREPPPSPYPPPLSRSATYVPQPTAPPSPAPPFLHHNSEGTHPYAQVGPSAGFPAVSSTTFRQSNGLIPLQEAVALNRERTIRAQQLGGGGSARANSGPGSFADSSRAASGSSSLPRGEGGTKKLFRKRTSVPGTAPSPPSASPYPPIPPRPQPPAIPSAHYASYSPSSYYPDRLPYSSTYPPVSPHQPTSLPASPISPHTPAYPAYPSTASLPHLPISSPRTPEEFEAEQLNRIRRESLESEQARLAALQSQTNQLLSTLDSSAHEQAELDRLQAEEEERLLREALERSRIEEEERGREERRRRLEEEKEVQRAIQASRTDKGKGRASTAEVEDEVSRREREALELAMQLSLEETGRRAAYGSGRTETSAQAFERYSLPSTSSDAHPAHPSAPLDLVAIDSEPDDLPPAYEYPAYAPEFDLPTDVILGPGRPLPVAPPGPPNSYVDTVSIPPAARGPLPIPPIEISSSAYSTYSPHPPALRHDSASSNGYDSLAATAGSFSDLSGSARHADEAGAAEGGDDPFDDRFEASDGEDVESGYSSVAVSEAPSAASSQEGQMKDLFAAVLARRATIRANGPPELHLAVAGPHADHDRGEDLSLLPPLTSTNEALEGQQVTPTTVTSLPIPSPPVPPASAPTTPPLAQPLLTPPTIGPTPASAPASPAASFRSDPSFGGFVEDATSPAAFADEHILRDVRWGFVNEAQSKSGRYSSLEHEGDFPRGAQLSLGMEEDGRQLYRSFAVEARTWQGLLVYLMWHGNSRLEAAPADLQGEKSGRGLRVAIAVDFFRSPASNPSSAVSVRPPRVRVRITLQPPSQDSPNSHDTASVTPVAPASLEPVNPSIRLTLDMRPYLPLPLSALATILSRAHTQSRQALRSSHVSSNGNSAGAVLARAVDLFRRLNGETVTNDFSAESATDEHDEYGLLDRMKARLRRRRGPRVLHSDDGRGPVRRPTGGPLPEGALLITPFSIDPT